MNHVLAHFPTILANEQQDLRRREEENRKRTLPDATPDSMRKPTG
jgi:hypothetical protein